MSKIWLSQLFFDISYHSFIAMFPLYIPLGHTVIRKNLVSKVSTFIFYLYICQRLSQPIAVGQVKTSWK